MPEPTAATWQQVDPPDPLHRDAPVELAIPQWSLWAFALAIVVVYVATIGWFGMSEPDEARYAEIPREMLLRGDWVTPHLNYVKYFEKPPLLYWLVSASYAVFGSSAFVARLWPVLFAFLALGIAYVTGRSMWNAWTGRVAVLVLATSPLFFGLSQVLSLDMPLSSLITAAAACFWLAYAQPAARRWYVMALYGALALAVLTKGPVALVLVGGIIAAFIALRREWSILGWLISPLGLVLFFAISAPWHLVVQHRNPEFFDYYIYDQHFRRYLTGREHYEPLWYFLPIVFGGAAPWTVLCLMVPSLCRSYLSRLLRLRVSPATLYATLWAAVVLGFFSLSGSKLAPYIVPCFPPMALLLARFLQTAVVQRPQVLAHAGIALASFAVLMLVASIGVGELVDDPNGPTIASRLALAGLPIVVCGIATSRYARRQRPLAALGALAAATLSLQLVVMSGRALAPCYERLGTAIRKSARPEDLVMTYGHYTQGIPLYAQRRVVMVGTRGELAFGSRQGDHSAFFWEGDDELVAAWSQPRRAFLVINRKELESLRGRLHPAPRQIASQGKKLVVVNFAG